MLTNQAIKRPEDTNFNAEVNWAHRIPIKKTTTATNTQIRSRKREFVSSELHQKIRSQLSRSSENQSKR